MIVGFGDLDPNELAPSRSDLRVATDALMSAISSLDSSVQGYVAGGAAGAAAADIVAGAALATVPDLPPATVDAWNRYVAEVRNWDSGPDFLAHIINRTWLTDLVGYQQQFNGFLSQLQAAGVSSDAAAFTFSSHPGLLSSLADAAKSGASTIETALIIGGITLVGLYVFTLHEAGKTIRSTGLKVL